MTTITERPHLYSYSLNEVRYILNVSDPDTAGCAVEVEIYTHSIAGSGFGTLLTSFTLYPNPDGSIYCHVADYLKSKLAVDFPDPTGSLVQSAPKQLLVYYIRYRQVTTAAPDPAWTSDMTNKKIVLMGGVEKMKFKRNNFFASYMPLKKTFLTWQPSHRFVSIDQEHFITLLRTVSSTSLILIHQTINVVVKTVFTDGTDNTSTTAVLTNNILSHIKAGAIALGLHLISPAKVIHYYEISVTGSGGTVLANPYCFYINYDQQYTWRDFNYVNSLGGIDAIRIRGEVTRQVETSGSDVEHISYNDTYNTKYPREQYSEVNTVKRDIYKGDAGWQRTPAQQEALIELLISKARYEWIDGRWIKVLNLKKSQDMGSTTDSKWSFPVEWTYGYDDQVFTPKGVMLGAGTN